MPAEGRRVARSAALALLGLVAACADAPADTMADTMKVTGTLAYRERIALPPDAVATVVLQDVSRADAAATAVAKWTEALNGKQVPVAFVLAVDRAAFVAGHRYAVRGTIRDGEGRLMWTTDTVHVVDVSQAAVDLGPLRLVRTASSKAGDGSATVAEYRCGDTGVVARFEGDALRLVVGAESYELVRVRSASGARYETAPEAPRAMLWDRGETALLEIGTQKFPECRRTEITRP